MTHFEKLLFCNKDNLSRRFFYFYRGVLLLKRTQFVLKDFLMLLGQGYSQTKWEAVYRMTWMTILDLGKEATFKSSLANLVQKTLEGIQNTFSIFLVIIRSMLTASFSSHKWHLQEQYIALTSDVLASLPGEHTFKLKDSRSSYNI